MGLAEVPIFNLKVEALDLAEIAASWKDNKLDIEVGRSVLNFVPITKTEQINILDQNEEKLFHTSVSWIRSW